jgi:hypothetical protein
MVYDGEHLYSHYATEYMLDVDIIDLRDITHAVRASSYLEPSRLEEAYDKILRGVDGRRPRIPRRWRS